ncbi:hypothetical protein [Flyfo siphovirus Tbat2_3]|nr:hypothetical protein [Flyfo siphovirus Tbat2_3]
MAKISAIYYLPLISDEAHLRRVWKYPKKVITKKQQAWVHYMLSVWGRANRGDDSPQKAINVIGRLMIRSHWSQDKADQICQVVTKLHDEDGLRGDDLYRKARDIVIPQSSTSNIIALAKESDDVAFVERVMCKVIKRDSPVRSVAIRQYCHRNCPQDIARDIAKVTGCDIQAARKRVIWCSNILDAEMFYAMKREMENELLLNAA